MNFDVRVCVYVREQGSMAVCRRVGLGVHVYTDVNDYSVHFCVYSFSLLSRAALAGGDV